MKMIQTLAIIAIILGFSITSIASLFVAASFAAIDPQDSTGGQLAMLIGLQSMTVGVTCLIYTKQ